MLSNVSMVWEDSVQVLPPVLLARTQKHKKLNKTINNYTNYSFSIPNIFHSSSVLRIAYLFFPNWLTQLLSAFDNIKYRSKLQLPSKLANICHVFWRCVENVILVRPEAWWNFLHLLSNSHGNCRGMCPLFLLLLITRLIYHLHVGNAHIYLSYSRSLSVQT